MQYLGKIQSTYNELQLFDCIEWAFYKLSSTLQSNIFGILFSKISFMNWELLAFVLGMISHDTLGPGLNCSLESNLYKIKCLRLLSLGNRVRAFDLRKILHFSFSTIFYINFEQSHFCCILTFPCSSKMASRNLNF